MVLVDTSVWIDHLRRDNAKLAALLSAGRVLAHPFVIGEVACGNLHRRGDILALLEALPHAGVVDHHEALHFVDAHRLGGSGVGWIDVHLMASAVLTRCALWTLDRRLRERAGRLDIPDQDAAVPVAGPAQRRPPARGR